jgi:zinc transporter ZupT
MVATRGQRAAAAAANFDLDDVVGTPTRQPHTTSTSSNDNSDNIHDNNDDDMMYVKNTNGIRLRNTTTATGRSTVAADTNTADRGSHNNNDDDDDDETIEPESKFSEYRSYTILLLFTMITYFAYPTTSDSQQQQHHDKPTLHTVFYYGWISAISTGLGVIPLCFVTKMNDYYIGLSNAIAAGMMCAASYSLFLEGATFVDIHDTSSLSPQIRTLMGCVLGLLFIICTKKFLDGHEDEVKFGSLNGADTRKLLLIVFVMTLHSFSEGVGIGVSFGGEHGNEFGKFISASLAVHNVPEGLAVAIALIPRRVSKATAAIWCVVTSLPQPIMAVPAFMFVHSFLPLLPVGLGFAGGAMVWVAFMELLVEAYEDTKDVVMTGVVSSVALGVMIYIQRSIE